MNYRCYEPMNHKPIRIFILKYIQYVFMGRLRSLQNRLTANGWRYAIVAGLVSASFTVVHYWLFASDVLRFDTVFLAGLLGGFLYDGKAIESHHVGFRTGVVGALPALWTVFDTLIFIPRLSQPAWFGGVQAMMLFAAIGLMVTLSALSGMVGAMVGNWVAGKTDRHRPLIAGN